MTAEWLRGRTALVTGASSGMGRAIALELGRQGANVGINYCRNRQAAATVADEVAAAGGSGHILQADVSSEHEVARMFAELQEACGERLDFLVCNAGEWMDKSPIAECSLAQWQRMLAVNATSVFLCCQLAARKMIAQGEGAIVTVGSVAGHTGGGGGTVPYAAAKAAVHTFTRGLARELGPHGIRVNGIAPGVFDTPMQEGRATPAAMAAFCRTIPISRMGRPEEVVPLVLALLSPASGYITGEIIEINGGLLMR